MAPVGRKRDARCGGYALTIETVYDDEIRADLGALTAAAMRRVEAGLRAGLGMPD